ncbi:MAG: hypothetical protein E7393_02900 [Ruminococcaceae bacterium]|nr:hypothetical protein [Oscillospiraceae bacterium]
MELHYFLTTNGSSRHKTYTTTALSGYKDVIYLEGYPRKKAETLVRECYAIAKQNKMDVEIIHNCLDNSLEGILLPQLQTALMNFPIYEQGLSLAALFKNEALKKYRDYMEKAYACFAEAKEIHDEWENIYINSTNYTALDQFTEETAVMLLADKRTDHKGSLCDRFLGAATINGSVDYIDILSADIKRYLIKGRPGTGKSTLLKKIAQSAYNRGFHTERYHCSFDPNSLDMIIIREAGICLFDSTAPHEYFPSRTTDEVLDLYATAVQPDTDRVYQKELSHIANEYKKKINMATENLILANTACNQAEETYTTMIDTDQLVSARKNIVTRLFP